MRFGFCSYFWQSNCESLQYVLQMSTRIEDNKCVNTYWGFDQMNYKDDDIRMFAFKEIKILPRSREVSYKIADIEPLTGLLFPGFIIINSNNFIDPTTGPYLVLNYEDAYHVVCNRNNKIGTNSIIVPEKKVYQFIGEPHVIKISKQSFDINNMEICNITNKTVNNNHSYYEVSLEVSNPPCLYEMQIIPSDSYTVQLIIDNNSTSNSSSSSSIDGGNSLYISLNMIIMLILLI